ncbi:hypothetical protein D7V68_08190 [Acinetobacter cumulans]|nr:hypothetical protein D7V68_08190 [Acinetobacter cumulans]
MCFLISIFIYVLIVIGGQRLIVATGGNDADTIKNLEIDGFEAGDSYAVMAFLYNIIPSNLILIITLCIGSAFIYYCYSGVKYKFTAIGIFIMLLVPMVLTIATFQKDLILVLFILPVFFVLQSDIKTIKKIFFISFVYVIYAFLFRFYYYLIILVFLSICVYLYANLKIRILYILGSIITLFFIPNPVYYELQSARDVVNEYRVGLNQIGYRTAYLNPMPPDSLFNFLFNYIYSILRLNFGFIFNYGFKDVAFTIYPLIYFYYIFKGIVNIDDKMKLAGALILAHTLVYFLFEPDTGSYARHLSSTLPYLALIIVGVIKNKSHVK